MKLLLLLMFCLCLPYFAFNQQEEGKSGLGFFVYGGLQMPQINNLNTFLENNGYPNLSENQFSGGFSLFKETGKIFNTVELYGYNSQRSTSGNFTSLSLIGSSISFGYSFSFTEDENFKIIPSIALNAYRASLKTSVAPTSGASYPNYIGNGNMEEVICDGIGGAFNLTLLTSPFKKWQSLNLGVRTGYNYTIESSWETINNQNVSDVPDAELLGYSASLVLGLRF